MAVAHQAARHVRPHAAESDDSQLHRSYLPCSLRSCFVGQPYATHLCPRAWIAWRAMAKAGSQRNDGAAADVLTIFGITGDLAKKMTFRALYRLEARGKLDCPIVGVAIDEWDDEQLREHAREAIAATRRGSRRGRLRPPRRAASPTSRATTPTPTPSSGSARRSAARRRPVFYLEIPPSLFATVVHGLAGAGLTERRPRRDREALRPRPRVGAGAQRRTARGARRGADPAHRPLPRQGAGDGHHLPALRQLGAGAGLEPRARLARADDDRRGLRRRRPRPLLRRGRGDARRDPEPRPAGARAGRDGAADRQPPRLDPRQEARILQGDAHRRPEALRARPVRRLPRRQGRRAGLDHRDLRRGRAGDRQLALERRPLLHPRRQEPAGQGARGDRRLQAAAAARGSARASCPSRTS